MPRYFFDLADGSREQDEIGTDLPNLHAAEREAIRFLGEVLKHEPDRLAADTLRVEVRERGTDPLWVVHVSVSGA